MRRISLLIAVCSMLLVVAGSASARSQWAYEASASSQYGDSAWSAMMATGAPDVTTCGDNGNAWATKDAGSKGYLDAYFEVPVKASQLWIYQSYNPGAITKVTVHTGDAKKGKVVYTAKPVIGGKCPATLKITLKKVPFAVEIVRIYVDQKLSRSWAEIDAVRLIGRDV